MYTLWFPPTYGPLARRTTRVWAVFQTLPPCAKSLVPRLICRYNEQFRGIHKALWCNPCQIASVSINLLFQVSVQAKYGIEHNPSHLDWTYKCNTENTVLQIEFDKKETYNTTKFVKLSFNIL